MNEKPITNECELYDRINEYRKLRRTSALAYYDVQDFIDTQSSDLHPDGRHD
jgi:hypothetical protein